MTTPILPPNPGRIARHEGPLEASVSLHLDSTADGARLRLTAEAEDEVDTVVELDLTEAGLHALKRSIDRILTALGKRR